MGADTRCGAAQHGRQQGQCLSGGERVSPRASQLGADAEHEEAHALACRGGDCGSLPALHAPLGAVSSDDEHSAANVDCCSAERRSRSDAGCWMLPRIGFVMLSDTCMAAQHAGCMHCSHACVRWLASAGRPKLCMCSQRPGHVVFVSWLLIVRLQAVLPCCFVTRSPMSSLCAARQIEYVRKACPSKLGPCALLR